jgi:exodeoxyribonuclease VII small subunit
LEAIVHELEEGKLGLDASLERFEQGVKLLRQCQEILERTTRRIELLVGVDADGNPVSRPMDAEPSSLEEKAGQRSRRRGAGGEDNA